MQNLSAGVADMQEYLALVARASLPPDQSGVFEPVDNVGDGGLTELERCGQSRGCGFAALLDLLEDQQLGGGEPRGRRKFPASEIGGPQDPSQCLQSSGGQITVHADLAIRRRPLCQWSN